VVVGVVETHGRQGIEKLAQQLDALPRKKIEYKGTILGRAPVHDWRKYLYLSAVHRFLRESPAVDVHLVTQEPED